MFMNSSMVNALDVAVKVEEEEAYICYSGVENIWSLPKRNEDKSLQFHMEKESLSFCWRGEKGFARITGNIRDRENQENI